MTFCSSMKLTFEPVSKHLGTTLFLVNWEPPFFLRTPSLWPQFGAVPCGLTLVLDPLDSNAGPITYKAVYNVG